jgi:hypothetical protein
MSQDNRKIRFGDGFTVPGAAREVYNQYVAELKKQNRPADNIRFASAVWCLIVSNDPETTFAEAANHISSIRPTITRNGYLPQDLIPFPTSCGIANNCAKAGFSKSSPLTPPQR